MNTEVRKYETNGIEKYFFKLMNTVFRKTMENARNHIDIKLATTTTKGDYLVQEPNYQTTKTFSENLLAIEMKRIQILMNKPVYLGLSILEMSKTVMYELWYDYVKLKYRELVTWIQTTLWSK